MHSPVFVYTHQVDFEYGQCTRAHIYPIILHERMLINSVNQETHASRLTQHANILRLIDVQGQHQTCRQNMLG